MKIKKMGVKLKKRLPDLSDKSLKVLYDLMKTLDPEVPYRVFVLDLKKLRSNNQNRYYRGPLLKVISEHTGYDTEDLHELFKAKFNLKSIYIGMELMEFSGSTAKLNTVEFEEYLEKIRRFSQQYWDCYVPKPNEMPDEEIVKLMNEGY